MFNKKIFLLIVITLLIMFSSGCLGEEKEETGQEEEVPEELDEIEMLLLEIMEMADLIPLSEEPAQMGSNGEENEEDEAEEEEEEEEEKIITFEETILLETIKKEIEENDQDEDEEELEPTEDPEELWDEIKTSLTELYETYNQVEPILEEENIPESEINNFEDELDNLTLAATEQDYFATLTKANEASLPPATFREPFSEVPMADVFKSKYHLRQILLETAQENYENAVYNLNQITELKAPIEEELNNQDEDELSEKYSTSLDNLQNSLEEQEPYLIRVNAAIVMENIVEIIETLEEESPGD